MPNPVDSCTHGQIEGTVSLEEASRITGIEPKRLRGRIWRDSVRLGDPIGCPQCGRIYADSLPKATPSQPAGVRS